MAHGEMSAGLTWDYEVIDGRRDQYHVYASNGPLEDRLSPFTLHVCRTPEHDADVQAIVEALRRIAARQGADDEGCRMR